MHHLRVREFVDRDRVAVAAAFRQRQRLAAPAARMAARCAAPPAASRRRPAASNGCCSRPRNSSRRSRRCRRATPSVLVTIAGPNGSQACSCSRIHCTRTGTPGQRARDQGGVGRGIIGAVVAVTSGALDMDAADASPAACRSISAIACAVGIDALGVGPDRHGAVDRIARRRRTGRSSRAPDTAAYSVASIVFAPAADGLLCSKIVVSCDGRPVRRRGRSSCFGSCAVSRHFAACRQRAHRLDRLVFLRGDDGEEVAVAHDLDDAGQSSRPRRCRTSVKSRAVARRPHDPGMHHARAAACPEHRRLRR